MSDETEDEKPENTPEENNPEGEGGAAEGAVQEPNEGNPSEVSLNEFDGAGEKKKGEEQEQKTAHDLEAVFDVPVNISAVLGRTHMEVSELLHLESGDVIELDRKVGEAIDIYVNNRLIARGEVVLLDDKLGITMTEIIKTERH